MLLFYIRHGDPVYNPDSLTPLGKRQADALAKRLALYGVDKIYSSTSDRAKQTAQPTCELLKKELTALDFCNENIAWEDFTIQKGDWRGWMFQDAETSLLLNEDSVRDMGYNWYDHPQLKEYNLQKGYQRIQKGADDFLLSLGYEHIPGSGKFKPVQPNNDRVALFAHQSVGLVTISHILDIPYPQFCTHFDMCHTGMTVIDFKDNNGYVIPKMLTLSNDSHLYREGLPTNYNNELRF